MNVCPGKLCLVTSVAQLDRVAIKLQGRSFTLGSILQVAFAAVCTCKMGIYHLFLYIIYGKSLFYSPEKRDTAGNATTQKDAYEQGSGHSKMYSPWRGWKSSVTGRCRKSPALPARLKTKLM
jgi:hypothetical protein